MTGTFLTHKLWTLGTNWGNDNDQEPVVGKIDKNVSMRPVTAWLGFYFGLLLLCAAIQSGLFLETISSYQQDFRSHSYCYISSRCRICIRPG
jgi:hypothetical protein